MLLKQLVATTTSIGVPPGRQQKFGVYCPLRSLARLRWDQHHLHAQQARCYGRFATAVVLGFTFTRVLGLV